VGILEQKSLSSTPLHSNGDCAYVNGFAVLVGGHYYVHIDAAHLTENRVCFLDKDRSPVELKIPDIKFNEWSSFGICAILCGHTTKLIVPFRNCISGALKTDLEKFVVLLGGEWVHSPHSLIRRTVTSVIAACG
jgi:hypothetical protein